MYNILRDNKIIETVATKDDAYRRLMKIQFNSTHHALKYEGYAIECAHCKDEKTLVNDSYNHKGEHEQVESRCLCEIKK